jgi:hypothetical protein
MTDYTPTWETIAGALITVLTSSDAIDNASNGYPTTPIAVANLTHAVIREPDVTPTGFTMGSVSITYSNKIDVLVSSLSDIGSPIITDAPKLTTAIINDCAEKALRISVDLYQRGNRSLDTGSGNTVTYVELGKTEIGRFTPWSLANNYHYAGLSIPYSITMQYRSN